MNKTTHEWTCQHTSDKKTVYEFKPGYKVIHDWTTKKAYFLNIDGEVKYSIDLTGITVIAWEQILVGFEISIK